MRRLNASISFDRRLYAEDVEGSLAWAAELRALGVLSEEEEGKIKSGLHTIRTEIESGKFQFSEDLEDSRKYFRSLRELRDEVAGSTGLLLEDLSMGMTHDFEVAIEEGATYVRIGEALFGKRASKNANRAT